MFIINESSENREIYLTKNEYIAESKKILSAIMNFYDSCYEEVIKLDKDDNEDNYCTYCGGGHVIEGGEDALCRVCNGTGEMPRDTEFNIEKFSEKIEHGIIFTDEFKFLELVNCEIKTKNQINKIKKSEKRVNKNITSNNLSCDDVCEYPF